MRWDCGKFENQADNFRLIVNKMSENILNSKRIVEEEKRSKPPLSKDTIFEVNNSLSTRWNKK